MNSEHIEILVEERSMEIFLNDLLPKILPDDYEMGVNCFVRPHQGKSHLLKSLPRKSEAYKHFGYPIKMVVIHDQDSNDCKALKQKIVKAVRDSNTQIPLLVRIACKELENWYLGDLNAIEQLYSRSNATRFQNRAKFRDVDRLNGSEEMDKFSVDFTKTSCAKNIVEFLEIGSNTSQSFNQFISGLQTFLS